ncbi:prolipoprotein diacylglyceryl transferase [Clostridium sp. Marseille-P299]|uniref:prolipoprotein diacylglyceryl transferase n=1 Tax=Clostridium sp. Marseille-P299 TaxID=1805477 RepID=UPI001FA7884D|nr:prolipoprotein diacylglyceryl transferase [Clostridium sp. Marseille-P299]
MFLAMSSNINFPNLGLELNNVPSGFTVFGFYIAFYGVVIATGMILGVLMAQWQAKRTGQNPELYLDFALYAIILSVIGARIYYVAFAWDEFKADPIQIINLRTGGLAIYGGVITAVITGLVYCRIKKVSFGLLGDTGMLGMLVGQIIGRWGNFFNKEAFGKYTDGLFAMQLDINAVSSDYTCSLATLTNRYADRPDALERIIEIRNNTKLIDGITYIQVHPTFLYESVWNLILLICLIFYSKHKKFNGEILLLYLAGYGLGRVWIEGLRTDQLFLWNSPIAVSQLLSALLVIVSILIIAIIRIRLKKKTA